MTRFKSLIIILVTLAPLSLVGQSKVSYSLLFNQSQSLDPMVDICIFRTTGGECVSMDISYALNATAAINLKLNDRVRLQTGLGYNQLATKDINDNYDRDVFKAKYLSVPIRAHWIIAQGKLSPYLGAGIRTDIRINEAAGVDITGFRDNARGFGLSAEFLFGLELAVNDKLSVLMEPTYATGLSNYDNGDRVGAVNPSSIDFSLMPASPQRIGITLGLNFRLSTDN